MYCLATKHARFEFKHYKTNRAWPKISKVDNGSFVLLKVGFSLFKTGNVKNFKSSKKTVKFSEILAQRLCFPSDLFSDYFNPDSGVENCLVLAPMSGIISLLIMNSDS